MKKSTFSDSKIPVLLKEAEPGRKVNHICHEHGISDAQPLQRGSLINIRRYYIRSKRRPPERLKTPFQVPPMPNLTWSLNFMSGTLQDGHRYRVLNLIDEGSRECLDITIGPLLTAARVARVLGEQVAEHGCPRTIRLANSVEMTSSIFTEWYAEQENEIVYIQADIPNQNAFVDYISRSLRNEISVAHLFYSLNHGREHSWAWHRT